MARYGLQSIQDPAVDEVFRKALGTLKGRPLVGVIGSIGMRKDAKAVESLASLLKDANQEVAEAAARSLGKIGTGEASRALQQVSWPRLPLPDCWRSARVCCGVLKL